jgi:hypothetical protein
MNEKQKQAKAWGEFCIIASRAKDVADLQKKCDELIKSIATWD